jgi:glutamate/tyrosine decarboxylase-like PLP-dependent enzyme
MTTMTDALLGPARPEPELLAELDDLLALDDATISARAGQLSYWALAPSAVRDLPSVRFGNEAGAKFMSDSLFYVASQPSLIRLNDEVLAMVRRIVGGGPEAAGVVTVGGTESNALAMKAARDRGRALRPEITNPEVVLCRTAHPSFHKAAHWLGLRVVSLPFAPDYRADADAIAAAITPSTVMLVGSAPSYTHGVYDPIEALGALALEHDAWLHVDACVGGIISPYLRRAGAAIPRYDLSIDGVSSISADLHKHAYAPVGISTLTFRDAELRDAAAFRFEDWPNGLHRGPTFISSRSAAPLAGAWAVLSSLGDAGLLAMADRLNRSRELLLGRIRAIDGLEVLGDPQATMWTVSSPSLDVYAVAEGMEARGWDVSRTREPEGMHLIVDPFEDDPLIADYLVDLADAAAEVRDGRRTRATERASAY